ncbi:response regulator [Oricola sp.]|uniref:response regulator n=1 Tax=Oricola sp. TaxID=1979950 RepID=UPI0025FA683E|nr:response regulator [Oricola sp.]MCI5078682.1 response regulator [Oricola sp.]
MKFLALDDIATNCAVLKQLARKVFDTETVMTTSPYDALDLCARERFDALIVDYFMPKMDGIEFTRSVRLLKDYDSVPIIMVTIAKEKRLRSRAIDAGVTDFLTKPVCALEFRKRLLESIIDRDAA